MKLFAPKNDWNMTNPGSWWPMMGSVATHSGLRVSHESAMTLSAVFAATRIISETMGSLPLNMIEQQDARTTRKAIDHPQYSLFHDAPNTEQDIMSWLDMQVAFQVNWGDAFAEKQFDTSGVIVAYWPIHPSRIPVRNIRRNPTDRGQFDQIIVGKPGELVYYVNNDDGTVTPIPTSDMLHVPGVLSSNGVTGQGIIKWGANSIGIALSTEEHAGAFFRNGAVSNVAIKSPKAVGPESAKRLREQWQSVFGGVKNHYKTLLLEDGMEPVPFSIPPEASQMVLSRQFGVTEVARWYRMPPHFLADLSASKYATVEVENQNLITHTMMPWIVRWEKALYRQCLTPEEKKKYRFKFNVNGMLRGDSAARGMFYQTLFNLGAFSPNDIREREDENPIKGGDQYFVQGNNAIPLDKIGELTQANIDKAKAPPPAPQPPAPDQAAQTAAHERLIELRQRMDALIMTVELRDATQAERDRISIELERIRRTEEEQRQEAHEKRILDAIDSIPVPTSVEPVDIDPLNEKVNEMIRIASSAEEKITECGEALKIAITDQAPVDTSAIEELAAKKALFDKEKSEQDEKLATERQATERVLSLAIKRDIDKLAEWEWKWLDRAIEKPGEWVDARVKYYQRFTKYFVSNLGEYVPTADGLGVVLDLEWAAKRYADDSIRDLKALDPTAADNHHDRLKECVTHYRNRQWTERSATLANEMIARGRQLFAKRITKE